MKELLLRNTQRDRPLDRARLTVAARRLIEDLLRLKNYALAVHFVSARRMEEMNRHYLGHEGSTDVITFDYRAGYSGGESEGADLAGEIFISVADAVSQGEKFRRPWEEEVLRYMVHGVLHLRGYDDLEPVARKKMKAAENRLLKKLLAPAN
jgi:probable rRNA maturation factor